MQGKISLDIAQVQNKFHTERRTTYKSTNWARESCKSIKLWYNKKTTQIYPDTYLIERAMINHFFSQIKLNLLFTIPNPFLKPFRWLMTSSTWFSIQRAPIWWRKKRTSDLPGYLHHNTRARAAPPMSLRGTGRALKIKSLGYRWVLLHPL